MNGRAKAIENASMVTIGSQNSPCVDLMSTEPTIGPVHENDTSTSVSAMKNTPARPFLSAPLSLLFTSDCGSVISNAPKNDAAKIMNTMKKMIFGNQCVESQLKMSAVTASPPIILVSMMITEIGTVYRSTMKRPYIAALKRPCATFSEPFIKKETVIGTIGKTHGVRSIANPQRMASRISPQIDPFLSDFGAAASASPTSTSKS